MAEETVLSYEILKVRWELISALLGKDISNGA